MVPMSIKEEGEKKTPAAPSGGKRKGKQPVKFKKAPQAPRRFKSAYMFFSTEKHPEIRARLKKEGIASEKTTKIAKMVSQEWKDLSNEERAKWEEMARQDKARFEMEKTMYTGPWKIPAKKRSQKDPDAPKRPMSAFLSFSNSKRAETRRANPHCSNAEISRILAQLWKEASEEERKEHIDREYKLRQEYKVAIAEWKETNQKELQAQRHEREEVARKAAATREGAAAAMPPPPTASGYEDGGQNSQSYYYPQGGHHHQGDYYSQEAPQGAASQYPPEGGGAQSSYADYGGAYGGGYGYSNYPPPQYGGYSGGYEGGAQAPYYGSSSYGQGYSSYYPQQYNYGGYEGPYEEGPPPPGYPNLQHAPPPMEGTAHIAAAPGMYDYA